jgi:hypothetical protein
LIGLGGAARFLLGPGGALATVLLYLIPEGWWIKAGDLLSQGFEIIKGIVSAAADSITGLINRIRSAIDALSNLSFGGVPSGSAPSTMEGFPGVDGARARGGSVHSGRLYTVGERGPELFSPSRTGRIIAPYDLAGPGAGSNGSAPVAVSATFHIHGATDPNAVARLVSQRLNQIARSAVHDGVYD